MRRVDRAVCPRLRATIGNMQDSRSRQRAPFLRLGAVAALLFGGLLFYSQTVAFAWDEGFHLLAAQLIKAGKKPYLDFCFPQTPAAAYWNAAWMRIFGESWRTVHAIAALCASAFLLGLFHQVFSIPLEAVVGGIGTAMVRRKPKAQPAGSSSATGARFCSKCGTPLAAASIFCSRCGARTQA